MKFKKPILLALSLGLGLFCTGPALAVNDGDTKTEYTQDLTPADGGYWLLNTTKIFRYKPIQVLVAAQAALTAALGRAPTAAEMKTYLDLQSTAGDAFTKGQIALASSRPDLDALALFNTPELRARAGDIAQYYEDILGRRFDEQGLKGWVNSGLSLDQIKAGFFTSPEYQTVQAQRLPSVDSSTLALIVAQISAGRITYGVASQQAVILSGLAKQNRNSDYLSEIPAAYLNWDPAKGALSAALAQEVGALGQGWEPRFVDAYEGLNIDPTTKLFLSGPLKGQRLAADYPTALNQLKSNNYLTQDWSYDQLFADIGGQGVMDSYAAARGNANFWTANLFSKQNMADPTFIQRYSQQLITEYELKRNNPGYQFTANVWTSWYYDSGWYNAERAKGLTPDQVQDEMVRYWMSVDGVGSFSTGVVWGANGPAFDGRGGLDADILVLENLSTAAKLVAESKALRAVGLTAQADAKIVQARNIVLLDGNNHDPLVLDLNHNGRIDVTGLSSSKYRNKENLKFVSDGSVKFDLLANGKPVQTEWIKGGDAFLVDNTKNLALDKIASGKALTGAQLFGDVEGCAGGFMKLTRFFDKDSQLASLQAKLTPNYGILAGKELERLMLWVDNGDGVAQRQEMKTLSEVGITEIGIVPQIKKEKGELFEQSYFVQNGKKYTMQEVWFMGK